MDFLGYDLSFLGTPTDNGKKVIIQSYSQKRLKKKRWAEERVFLYKGRFFSLHLFTCKVLDFFSNPLKKNIAYSTSLFKTKNIAITLAMTQFLVSKINAL
ncbi:hypothetical protein SMUL_0725 [Sulfurospirillum multivorans DSM 12446]|uniref:Uncharacterized protein n=2 Tax=Sulfurospirillum multivorans TaxID=66821 RepID=A0AA86AK47_SULMK|nr:hypothetical protein SMUL_0725 [Sulfurospirillum multivorans DSM 12446]